ncbi:GTPase [Marchantia polymorpha subsp. ruderalis]|uniref:Era-type G domain-containing protein n=1 Tax=Marchantia polymorpha TaxID=3197 RepID=A0A2R6WV70_MARPO|nr:hypothetical protein MARPO_0055s0018 [Marchantia polymorpha]BBN03055.1 hypothetical protein Mp_2g20310 [Marchantia polymorpha subsp. ruderalis]|eukprot:PTQ37730.1 hypothetical protein MARPO_0055s0018 [Marchantia polymorpha]
MGFDAVLSHCHSGARLCTTLSTEPQSFSRSRNSTDSVGLNSNFPAPGYRNVDCKLSTSGGRDERSSSFWGRGLPEAMDFTDVEKEARRRGRRVLAAGVHASASQQKPPIFVLKKPDRKPIENEGGNSGPKFVSSEFGDMSFTENHKSGYVALVGKPNVGKSTLLNQIIGQKLSIVTNKPQTTRHRILGICSSPDYQMILYDTPGFIPKTMRRLDEMMMQNVRTATINADCILVVVDACQVPEKMVSVLEEGMSASTERRPTLLVLNKIDLIKPGEITKKTEWYESFGGMDNVIPVSAKMGRGVDLVKNWLVDRLPKGPAYYPKDIVSEHPERFFVAEIVREKIFLQYRQEIPYVSQVNVLNYTERRSSAKDFIEAEIVVERDSQMAILIGKDGSALKLLATASRIDIQEFVGKEVYLELKVKVRENWREDDELLDYYGYNGKIRS